MRLGGHIFGDISEPGLWISEIKARGYSAAYFPLEHTASDADVRAFADAAEAAGIVIAENGAWSNPISTDAETRRTALDYCQKQLELADRVGARCCVNIAGGRGAQWDGPHPDNLSADTFDLIVESVRLIIDAVKPKRAFYALETMPWIFPDSPESYLRLLKAIDRPQFAVHLDPVNMINSPQRCFENGAFIRECFALLGPYIKSCHGKDIALAGNLTVHLDEVRPGTGSLDYAAFLQGLNTLDADVPLMLEHLASDEDYNLAAAYIRNVAAENGVTIQ